MTDAPYSNRELDAKFAGIHDKLDNNRTDIMTELGAIRTQTTATNGKVRKIIIALVLIVGVGIGLGIEYARIVLPLLIAAV